MLPPVFHLALLGAVGHQVTAPTPGELTSLAAGTEAMEEVDFTGIGAEVHHLAEAVGTKHGRAETGCHPEQKLL